MNGFVVVPPGKVVQSKKDHKEDQTRRIQVGNLIGPKVGQALVRALQTKRSSAANSASAALKARRGGQT